MRKFIIICQKKATAIVVIVLSIIVMLHVSDVHRARIGCGFQNKHIASEIGLLGRQQTLFRELSQDATNPKVSRDVGAAAKDYNSLIKLYQRIDCNKFYPYFYFYKK